VFWIRDLAPVDFAMVGGGSGGRNVLWILRHNYTSKYQKTSSILPTSTLFYTRFNVSATWDDWKLMRY
jgi:hypothetical protein